jgi:hypothetical protein
MNILLFLLWGSLFVGHLAWFVPPMPVPPLYVWIGQTIHLCLLISYLLGFWKEKIASAGMVLFSFIFFFLVIGNASGIVFFLLSSLPAGLYVLCWILERKQVVRSLKGDHS